MQQSSQSSDFQGIFSDSLSEEPLSHSQISKSSHYSQYSQLSSEFSQPQSQSRYSQPNSLSGKQAMEKKTKKALMKEKPIRKHPKPSRDNPKVTGGPEKKQPQQHMSIVNNSIIDSLLASANQTESNQADNQSSRLPRDWSNQVIQGIAENLGEADSSRQQAQSKQLYLPGEQVDHCDDRLKEKINRDSQSQSVVAQPAEKTAMLKRIDDHKLMQIASHALTNKKTGTSKQSLQPSKEPARRSQQKPKNIRYYKIPKINRQQYLMDMSCLSSEAEGPINLLNLNFHEVLKQFHDVVDELRIDPGIFNFVPELVEENEAITCYLNSIKEKVQVKSNSANKVLLSGLENFQIQELVKKVNKGELNSVKTSNHSQTVATKILTPADHRYYSMFLYKLCQIIAKLEHKPALKKLALKYKEKFRRIEQSTATFYSADTTEFVRYLYSMSEDEYELFREKCRTIQTTPLQQKGVPSDKQGARIKHEKEKADSAVRWKGPKSQDWLKTISKIRFCSQQPSEGAGGNQGKVPLNVENFNRGHKRLQPDYSQEINDTSHEQSIDFSRNHRNRAHRKEIAGSKGARKKGVLRTQGHGSNLKQDQSNLSSNTVTNKEDIFVESDEETDKKRFDQSESDFATPHKRRRKARKASDSFGDSVNIESNTFHSDSEINDDDVSSTDTEIFLQGQREALMRYIIKQSLEEGLFQYKRTTPGANMTSDVIGESHNLKFALIKKEVINEKKSENANFRIRKPGIMREGQKKLSEVKVTDLVSSFCDQDSLAADSNGLYAPHNPPNSKRHNHEQSLESDYEESAYDPGLINFENDMQQEGEKRRLRKRRNFPVYIEEMQPQQEKIFEEESLFASSQNRGKRNRKNSVHSRQNSSVISSHAYTSEDDEASSFSHSFSQSESRPNIKKSNWARFQSYYNNDQGEESYSVSSFSNGVKRAEKKFWRNHEKFKNNGVKEKGKLPKGQNVDWANIPIVNINKEDDGVESLEESIHNSIYSKSSASKKNLQNLVSQKLRLKDEI